MNYKTRIALSALSIALFSGATVASANTNLDTNVRVGLFGEKENTRDYREKEGVRSPRFLGVFGTVTAINGTTITLSGKQNGPQGTTTLSYVVDASNTKVYKNKNNVILVSDIKMGDRLFVEGTINGTTVIATSIFDSQFEMKDKDGKENRDVKNSTGLIGTVTAVNGTTLTIVGIQGRGNAMATTTYTVDAGSAVVYSGDKRATTTLSAVQTGDRVFVNGTTTGTTTIGARFIFDDIGKFFKKMGHGIRGWFFWGTKDEDSN
jgi:hypothetical protein